MCINCCISLNTSIYSANLSCSDQPSHGMYPVSTVTVSQPYANRWRNYCCRNVTLRWAKVAPTSTANHQPTLPQPSANVPQPSANVAPTISQRCLNHQPTLPQPSANVAPTISQRCPNHLRTLPQPSANVTPTIR